jgi:hypothetical protein
MTQHVEHPPVRVGAPANEGRHRSAASADPAQRPDTWWRQPYLWLVVLGGLVVFNLIYALPRYLSMDPSQSRSLLDPEIPTLHFTFVSLHAITGNIAMVTVFLQLWPWLRRHHPRAHRISGHVYIWAGALPSALLAVFALVPLRPFTNGSLGLGVSGLVWIVTTVIGLRLARAHRYAEHRRWMVYSFALAMATTWGRIPAVLLPMFPDFQVDVNLLVESTNWLSWVLNLFLAHWWVESRGSRQSAAGGQVVTYPRPL